MGLDWNYSAPADVYAEMASLMPSLNNISWERLERENAVTYPCDAPDKPGNNIVFGDGFPTATGRAKLVPAGLVQPDEQPDESYPMILTTGRQLEHWHTGAMTRRAKVLDEIEPRSGCQHVIRPTTGFGSSAGRDDPNCHSPRRN